MTTQPLTRRSFLKTSLFSAAGMVGLAAWRKVPIFGDNSPMATRNMPSSAVPGQHAAATYAKMQAAFALPGGRYREYLNPRPGDRPFATLWPYTGVVSALNALAALPGNLTTYADPLRASLSGLEGYRDAQAKPVGYDSYPVYDGGAQKYYDDNEWVGIEFIRAYTLLKDPAYLAGAKQVLAFALSGWSDALGGGIYWRQGDDATKNTCSNAPAAVLALLIHQATGDAGMLTWGMRILDWLKPYRSTDSGVYADSISKDGKIDYSAFTYNTGAVLHANALLYGITGDDRYLHDARTLARGACDFFAPQRKPGAPRLFPATPWFNAVLLRGYLAFAAIDPTSAQPCLDAVQQTLNTAWSTARGADELFSPDPSGATGRDDPHRWLLDQAGWVEMYALMGN
jgi:hypothetical protein